MHDVVLFTRSFRGDTQVEHGAEDSVLLVDWLEIDGHPAIEHSQVTEKVQVKGMFPGFVTLLVYEPSDELEAALAGDGAWIDEDGNLEVIVSTLRVESALVPA